jgi:hypothetical protein
MTRCSLHRWTILGLCVAAQSDFISLAGTSCRAATEIVDVIALTGDAASDGGEFYAFRAPVLNDVGQVAFLGYIEGEDTAIYRGDVNAVHRIVGLGDPAPGTNGSFSSFSPHHFHALKTLRAGRG